jgi:hypothetical protein
MDLDPLLRIHVLETSGLIASAGWDADPASKGSEPGKGLEAVGAQEVFGHPVNGRPVMDFGRGNPLGGQQRTVAVLGLAPLMVGTGNIDPVPSLPLSGGNRGRAELFRVLDGDPAVTEDLGDADLVEGDISRAEPREPAIGVCAKPGGGGVCPPMSSLAARRLPSTAAV